MTMKTLVLGILFIVLVGIGGLIYRNAVEHANNPIACPMDAKVCPDGTSVGRVGSSCDFPTCAPPNVSLDAIGLAYAVPEGFSTVGPPDPATVVAYERPSDLSPSEPASIIVRRYAINASSTALATIQATAIGGTSGEPVPATAYSSANIGTHRFTVVAIERFEGVVTTAYYLARGTEVLRFDAIDRGVFDWSDPALDVSSLPAASALRALLATLQAP